MLGRENLSRLSWLFFVLLAGAGSQAGHLIAYMIRFGPSGLVRQSQGIHAYLPGLVTGLGSLLGTSLLVGLLLVALARLVRRRHLGNRVGSPPLLETLAILFTVQIALYACQETAEAAAAGSRHPGLVDLLFLGSLGQLPAALLGALALRWLIVHVSEALAELTAEPEPVQPWAAILPPDHLHTDSEAIALLAASLAVFTKRGPPGPLPAGS